MLDDCNNIKVNCVNTEKSITTIVCTVVVQKAKHSCTTVHGILSLCNITFDMFKIALSS